MLDSGRQTDRERAYVALTCARDRMDAGAIERLADAVAQSNAQQSSIATPATGRDGRDGADPGCDLSHLDASPVSTTGGLWPGLEADRPTGTDTRVYGHESEAARLCVRTSRRTTPNALLRSNAEFLLLLLNFI